MLKFVSRGEGESSPSMSSKVDPHPALAISTDPGEVQAALRCTRRILLCPGEVRIVAGWG